VNPKSSRILSFLRIAWTNVAILVTLILAMELLGFSYHYIRNSLLPGHDLALGDAETIPKDAYPERSWLVDYFRENRASAKLRWVPYVYWRRLPFHGKLINVDEQGLRVTWKETPDPDRPAARINIAVFGGSTVWGTGARDEHTIPSYLSKIAADKIPNRYQVTNYGETGYVSTQEVFALIHELQRGYRPGIVVFYDGYNDLFSAYQSGVAGLTQNERNREREFNLLNDSRKGDFYREVLSRSNILSLLQSIRGKPIPQFEEPNAQSLAQQVVDVYSTNVAVVDALARKWNFVYRFCWQPSVFSKKLLSASEKEFVTSERPEARRFFELVDSAVRKSRELSENPAFRNISDAFDTFDQTMFTDRIHTSESGNKVIATRIFADLEKEMVKK